MEQEFIKMTQIARFVLEKRDAETGELLETVEGGDGMETIVTVLKEQSHGDN